MVTRVLLNKGTSNMTAARVGHSIRIKQNIQGTPQLVEGRIVAITTVETKPRVVFWIKRPFPMLCSSSACTTTCHVRPEDTVPWSEPTTWIEGCTDDCSFLLSEQWIEEHKYNLKRVTDTEQARILEAELHV